MTAPEPKRLPFAPARARILGSGAAFPTCTLPDGERMDRIETAWLMSKLAPELSGPRLAMVLEHLDHGLGVNARSWAHWITSPHGEGEEDSFTLGVAAARAALADAGIDAADLGMIVLATSTSPRWTSPLSARVAGALGARCGFLHLRSGCSSGPTPWPWAAPSPPAAGSRS